MTFDEFTGQVQHRARLSNTEDVLRATRATLTVLRERLAGGAPENLGGQLPKEIREYLSGPGGGEPFDLDEFYRRVTEVEGVDAPDAVHHARAVLSVVDEATSGMLGKEKDQLGDDFNRLLSDVEDFRRTYSS